LTDPDWLCPCGNPKKLIDNARKVTRGWSSAADRADRLESEVEILVSVGLVVASIFLCFRKRHAIARYVLALFSMAWAVFCVLIFSDALARKVIASEESHPRVDAFTAGVLAFRNELQSVGICIFLIVFALFLLAVVPVERARAS
jgi:peptidoglycan/LPS O-acetylase OafA/YrhL